jgi:hypothetical protein
MHNSYINTKESTFSFTCEQFPRTKPPISQLITIEPSTRTSRIYDRFNIQNTVSRSGSPIVNKEIQFSNTTSDGFVYNLRTSATGLVRNQNTSSSKSPRRFAINIDSRTNSPVQVQKLSTHRISQGSVSPPQRIIRAENISTQPRVIRHSVGSSFKHIPYNSNGLTTTTTTQLVHRVIGEPITRTVYATNSIRPTTEIKHETFKIDNINSHFNTSHLDKFPYPFEPGKGRYEEMLGKVFSNFHHDCYHKITNTKELNLEIEEMLQKVVKDAEGKLKAKHVLR